MIAVVSKIISIYVTRKGNRFIDRIGNIIFTIDTNFDKYSGYVQEGVEIKLSLEKIDTKEELEIELSSLEDNIRVLQIAIKDKLNKLNKIKED